MTNWNTNFPKLAFNQLPCRTYNTTVKKRHAQLTLPNPHSEVEGQVIFADLFLRHFRRHFSFSRFSQNGSSFRRAVIFTWVSPLKLILDTGLLVSLTVEDSREWGPAVWCFPIPGTSQSPLAFSTTALARVDVVKRRRSRWHALCGTISTRHRWILVDKSRIPDVLSGQSQHFQPPAFLGYNFIDYNFWTLLCQFWATILSFFWQLYATIFSDVIGIMDILAFRTSNGIFRFRVVFVLDLLGHYIFILFSVIIGHHLSAYYHLFYLHRHSFGGCVFLQLTISCLVGQPLMPSQVDFSL